MVIPYGLAHGNWSCRFGSTAHVLQVLSQVIFVIICKKKKKKKKKKIIIHMIHMRELWKMLQLKSIMFQILI